jgi:hypothetical protein
MLIFASDVWVTIDINPCKFHICRSPYMLVGSFSSWVRIHQHVHKMYCSTEWWSSLFLRDITSSRIRRAQFKIDGLRRKQGSARKNTWRKNLEDYFASYSDWFTCTLLYFHSNLLRQSTMPYLWPKLPVSLLGARELRYFFAHLAKREESTQEIN